MKEKNHQTEFEMGRDKITTYYLNTIILLSSSRCVVDTYHRTSGCFPRTENFSWFALPACLSTCLAGEYGATSNKYHVEIYCKLRNIIRFYSRIEKV